MPYDQTLADRIGDLVTGEEGLTQQRMFGGLAFLVNGNMAVAASGQGGLLVRVDADDVEAWIDDERVMPMVMRGREMGSPPTAFYLLPTAFCILTYGLLLTAYGLLLTAYGLLHTAYRLLHTALCLLSHRRFGAAWLIERR